MPSIEQIQEFCCKTQNRSPKVTSELTAYQALLLPFAEILNYDIFDVDAIRPNIQLTDTLSANLLVTEPNTENKRLLACFYCTSQEQATDTLAQIRKEYLMLETKLCVIITASRYSVYTNSLLNDFLDDEAIVSIDIEDTTCVSQEMSQLLTALSKDTLDLTVIQDSRQQRLSQMVSADIATMNTEPSDEILNFFSRNLQSNDAAHLGDVKEALKTIIPAEMRRYASTVRLGLSADKISSLIFPSDEGLSEEALELLVYYRSQLEDTVKPSRIIWREVQSYSSLLLDDNSRKPICRLLLSNPKHLRVELFTASNTGERHTVPDMLAIKELVPQLRERIQFLLEAMRANSKALAKAETDDRNLADSEDITNSTAENIQELATTNNLETVLDTTTKTEETDIENASEIVEEAETVTEPANDNNTETTIPEYAENVENSATASRI